MSKEVVREIIYVHYSRFTSTNSRISKSKINKYIKNFDETKVQPVTAYYDSDLKTFLLTDGNHRISFLPTMGYEYIPTVLLSLKEFDYVKYSKRTIDLQVFIPVEPKFIGKRNI